MTRLFERPDWIDRAACRGEGPRRWYRPDLEHNGRPDRSWSPQAAVAICERCPVTYQCLTDALDRNEHDGVWGGFDFGVERRSAQAAVQRATRKSA